MINYLTPEKAPPQKQRMYTVIVPGALTYVEVPFKKIHRYFKPFHAGPPYNTIVTVLVDEETDLLMVTDDHSTTFTEIKNPGDIPPGFSSNSKVTCFFTE